MNPQEESGIDPLPLGNLPTKQLEKELEVKRKLLEQAAREIELERTKIALELRRKSIELDIEIKRKREERLAWRFHASQFLTITTLISGLTFTVMGKTDIGYFLLGGSGAAGYIGMSHKGQNGTESSQDHSQQEN